jgi:hypothetical protein
MDAEGMTGSGERWPSDLVRRGPGLGAKWRNAKGYMVQLWIRSHWDEGAYDCDGDSPANC